MLWGGEGGRGRVLWGGEGGCCGEEREGVVGREREGVVGRERRVCEVLMPNLEVQKYDTVVCRMWLCLDLLKHSYHLLWPIKNHLSPVVW